MKKIAVFIIFFLFTGITSAQFSKFKRNPFSNTIVLGISGGFSQSETDFRNNDLGLSGVGSVEYYFSNSSDLFFGAKFELGLNYISGNYKELSYETDIISLGPSFLLNYKLSDNFFPYLGLGFRNLWYGDVSALDLNSEIGIKYIVSKFFTLNGSLGFNFVFDDKLDGLEVINSNDDFFTTFSIGFSYAVDLTIKDDIDGDGILNSDDACPEQAEDYDGFEDGDGCPEFDNDDDGIVDLKDGCINEAEDYDGFEDEDGCPDPDNDGDGILDFEDGCPDLKEDVDNFNDLDGCPDLDNDNDGIVDVNDKCPDKPETFNNYEDLDGCPDSIPETEIVEEKVVIKEKPAKKITPETKIRIAIPNEFLLEGDKIFQNNSARIRTSAYKSLNIIADQMRSNPDFNWRIEGHLDNSGSSRDLKVLSTNRANAVRDYFVSKGLSPKQFQTIGLGDEVPIAPNSTMQGKLKNRRILIKRIR